MSSLTVRPMQHEDAFKVARYWSLLSPDEIKQLGTTPERVSPERIQTRLQMDLKSPTEYSRTFYLIWLLDGLTCGHATLSELTPGESGSIQVYLWNPVLRGQGKGASLLCLSVVDLYDRFGLKRMVCEPLSTNLPANRVMEKIGFPLQRHYTGTSDSGEFCELNQYGIVRQIASNYLQSLRENPKSADLILDPKERRERIRDPFRFQ